VASLRSQQWRSGADILKLPLYGDETVGTRPAYWCHWMTVVVPKIVRSTTSLLVVSGRSYSGDNPPAVSNIDSGDPYLSNLTKLSTATGTVVTLLEAVPNEPITFVDDPDNSRSEDAIIAYTYNKFVTTEPNNANTTWPLLLPMVKSAFRGMDAVQSICAGLAPSVSVEDFVVAGASKRGWTTWLTGAGDAFLSADKRRVKAIAPMVIDVLNMGLQMAHQKMVYASSYGLQPDEDLLGQPPYIWKGYSSAVAEYEEYDIFDGFNSLAGQALLDIVDPYRYRHRLTMPKLILNSTGDEFFLPDSSQFYLSKMYGDNHLHYIPNSHHELDQFDPYFPSNSLGRTEAVGGVLTFYNAMLTDAELPQIDWTVEADGSIRVTTDLAPSEVSMWQATNEYARDFRLNPSIGITSPTWYKTEISAVDNGVYLARPEDPITQWTGFFVQLKYRSPLPDYPYIFTTQVQVLPDTYFLPELYSYTGEATSVGGVPVVILNGTPTKMGWQYGYLKRAEIQSFLPSFIATAASAANQNVVQYSATLDAVWAKIKPYVDTRITEEMEGIASSLAADSNEDETYWLNVVRRANIIPILQSYSCSSVAVWGDATASSSTTEKDRQGHLLQTRDLDWPLDMGLQAHPCIAVYVPTDGQPHVNVSFLGMIGVQTGFNLAGISLADISETALTPYDLRGEPFFSFFRAILYDAKNLDSALSIIESARRIKNNVYVVGDGRWQRAAAKVTADSSQTYPDDYVVSYNDDENYPDVVVHDQGRGAWPFIVARFGKLTASDMMDLAKNIAKPGSNLLNVVYDPTSLELWFSYAYGQTDARDRDYIYLNLNDTDWLRQGSAK